MAITAPRSLGHRWQTYPAEEVTDALVTAMALGGVEYLFFSSGSDLIPFQEAIAKAQELGRPAPRLVTMLHEIVNLNAAMGYTMTSGRPAVSAVHVDAGTLNCGAGLHTVWRGNYPVVLMAGAAPTSLPGAMRGSREGFHYWYQELPDQGSIVRQFAKWVQELDAHDNPGLMMSRALQVAQTAPAGLAYLMLPREILMAPLDGATFPLVEQLGILEPVGLDGDHAERIVDLLVSAENPLVILGRSGRNPAAYEVMVALAEALALPVALDEAPDAASFPSEHALFGTGPALEDADVVLVIDSALPWIMGQRAPHPDATIITIGMDPIQSDIPTYEYPATFRCQADAARSMEALLATARERVTRADQQRIDERHARCLARKSELQRRREQQIAALADSSPIDPRWVSHQVGRLVDERTILVNDACTNAPTVLEDYPIRRPASYFRSGGGAGGWGLGAALGAKLGAPDQDVILTVGDGYYLFGVPNVTLWAAARFGAPFLTVLYQNDSYVTGTSSLKAAYPDGYAVRAGKYEGGWLHPSIDYVKEAEAAGAYAEGVSNPADVGPALARGLAMVRDGTPAVVVVKIPRLA